MDSAVEALGDCTESISYRIDNALVIYTKKFWIRKKWTCAVYIRKVWEVNQM
jgi:hypothetical protein